MRKLAIITGLAAALLLQSLANAGTHLTNPVSIYSATSGGGSAIGSVATARYYTSDTSQYIGCSSSSDTISSTYISCSARDAAGHYLYCYSSSASAAARDAVASVNTTSYVYFVANSSGQCTYITVGNFSYYL
ncbi:MAG TPA: hypothetical protein VI653_04100 [Steroidobacteraceae bacterium]